MSRITRRRTIRAVAPVAGLLAAGLLVWQGSYAAFSATTGNTGNAWTTGALSLVNNGGGTTYQGSTGGIFSETGMKIGDTGARCITVSTGSTLNTAGELRLYRSASFGTNSVSGETATQAATLAGQIGLTVTAVNLGSATGNIASSCSGFPTTGTTAAYTGTLSGLGVDWASSAGTGIPVPVGTQRIAYKFAWTLNSTGTNTGDNALQGLATTADLNWELQ